MGSVKLTITAFQVDFGDGPKEYLTCVDIERLNKGRGIPVEALIGVVLQPRENPGDPITPDNFRSNTAFINLLQGLMVEHGEWMDDMRINADALGSGVVCVRYVKCQTSHVECRMKLSKDPLTQSIG